MYGNLRNSKNFTEKFLDGIDFWRGLKKTLRELFENTTLHAYQYIVEANRHWTERFWLYIIKTIDLYHVYLIYFIDSCGAAFN